MLRVRRYTDYLLYFCFGISPKSFGIPVCLIEITGTINVVVLSHIVWVLIFNMNLQDHKFCNGEIGNGESWPFPILYSPFPINHRLLHDLYDRNYQYNPHKMTENPLLRQYRTASSGSHEGMGSRKADKPER